MPVPLERVMFCAGQFLYALNPRTGQPIPEFGDGGKTPLPGVAQGDFGAATAGPAIFERIIVVPGFEKDVWGIDLVTGKHLWTFHTIPQPGEFGFDTWDRTVSYGANCWGGMAMDEVGGPLCGATNSPAETLIPNSQHQTPRPSTRLMPTVIRVENLSKYYRLGIIGRNAPGRSALLKIPARISAPTEGRVKIRGRVGRLLEVGTGFPPNLSVLAPRA